jgi:hypothetical protein
VFATLWIYLSGAFLLTYLLNGWRKKEQLITSIARFKQCSIVLPNVQVSDTTADHKNCCSWPQKSPYLHFPKIFSSFAWNLC